MSAIWPTWRRRAHEQSHRRRKGHRPVPTHSRPFRFEDDREGAYLHYLFLIEQFNTNVHHDEGEQHE